MNRFDKDIFSDIEADRKYVIELRRYFHSHPEPSAKEYKTAEKIEQELRKIGLAHARVGETGVYAEITGTGNGAGKTVVLRADTDALPVTEEHACPYKSENDGYMHACGHDAHTAALLGAARVLAKNKDKFSGTVRLCFQQGEEIGYGARLFVDGGYLAGASGCVGVHMASNIDVGKISVTAGFNNASVDWFKINVRGKSAHVSEPERGADAAYIISQIVVAAQALVTRRTNPMENALLGIGKITAGTTYNVVAAEAFAEGSLRAFSPELRKTMKEMLTSLAKQTAQTFGGDADVEWKDFTSPLINDGAVTAELQKSLAEIFGEENIVKDRRPTLGGDDFAEFILSVPGTYIYVGSRNENIPETCVPHHNSRFDIDERSVDFAVKTYVGGALSLLK